MYAKQDNYLFVLPRTLGIFECGNIWEKWKNNIWEKWVTVLCELSCLLKEETTDSTYSALDEIVSSFMHEFLSIYTRFWASVRFFFTYSYSLTYHVSCIVLFFTLEELCHVPQLLYIKYARIRVFMSQIIQYNSPCTEEYGSLKTRILAYFRQCYGTRSFRFHRSFAERCDNVLRATFFEKYSQLTKNFKDNWVKQRRSPTRNMPLSKTPKDFQNEVNKPKFHVCLKCCGWLVVRSKVISTSMPAVHFLPTKISQNPVYRSERIVQNCL